MINVLTLSWNGLDKLTSLRPGLIKNLEKTGQDWTWYIRSNGCQDGTVEEISKWENVKILAVDHNRDNFAQGVNSLAELANASDQDHYLLLNNDIEFQDNISLFKMLQLMGPTVGVVGARLLYKNTDKLQHAGVIFGKQYGMMPYHYRHQELSDSQAERNRYFQAVTGAVCLINGWSFNFVKGLDPKLFWAFDDTDLCMRIGNLNRKIVYCGETNIFHEESASLKKNNLNKLFMNHNVAYFKSKWFGKYPSDHEQYLKDPDYNVFK